MKAATLLLLAITGLLAGCGDAVSHGLTAENNPAKDKPILTRGGDQLTAAPPES